MTKNEERLQQRQPMSDEELIEARRAAGKS